MDNPVQVAMLIAALTSAITSYLSMRFVGVTAPLRLLDHPNARSLHQRPIPKTGGLAVLAGIMVGVLLMMFAITDPPIRTVGFVLAGLAPLALVSFLDDRQGVAARWRILIHSLGAVSLLAAKLAPAHLDLPGLTLALPVGVAIPLTLLFVVWMVNLYNFMDGMDGFADGMAVIGFVTLS